MLDDGNAQVPLTNISSMAQTTRWERPRGTRHIDSVGPEAVKAWHLSRLVADQVGIVVVGI